jgi:hypothetical protein
MPPLWKLLLAPREWWSAILMLCRSFASFSNRSELRWNLRRRKFWYPQTHTILRRERPGVQETPDSGIMYKLSGISNARNVQMFCNNSDK